MQGAKDRRVRRDRAEQLLLDAQVLDVRAALTAASEHQRHLHQHLAAVVQGESLPDRIAYMGQWLRLTTSEATARVTARDERRADFLRTHFGRTPGEVHQYEMLLNSSGLGEENCAELIARAAELRWEIE